MQEAFGARPGRGMDCFYPQNANCCMPLQLGGCLSCLIIVVMDTCYTLLLVYWLCWVFISVHRLSLVEKQPSLFFVAKPRLLIAMDSLVVDHRL